ncbi:hypothetical protein UlMin_044730 [Ulmus minor]
MPSGCLSLFFADQILDKLPSLEEDEQLISPALKHELGKLKKVLSAVRATVLHAEGSRQRNKGLKCELYVDELCKVDFYFLENELCKVDFLVKELFCWVRETKRERERSVVVMPMLRRNLRNTTFTNLFLTNSPMKPFQMDIRWRREELEKYGGYVFDGFANISDRIKSGEEISIDSFGGDTEGETSSGKNKDQIIQSLIPPFPIWGRQNELLKSIGRRLLFENDDDDPDDVAINTLTNIFYFKYSSFFELGRREQVNMIFPERVINDLSTRLMQRYALLPLPVKYCFDYCSLFPRDYVIEVPLLLKLWMAQGFAVDEDMGRRYFEDLLARGFFQQLESDMLETTKCRMDSHAFALSAITSGSRYVLMRSDGQNYIPDAFHVSFDFHLYSQRQIPSDIIGRDFELIRSFLLPCQIKSKSDRGMIDPKKIHNIISPRHDSGSESVSDLLISKLDSLRSLDVHDLAIQSLPDYIDRLKHLRYLDVSRNPDIKLLPDSITKLWHLQTLKLSSCFGLRELPKDVKNLIHLRHLEIEGCFNLRYMPPHLGQLTNLQTLSQFVLNDDVRSAHDRKYCSQLKELGRLNSLRGELKIKNLSSIIAQDSAREAAALGDKQHLQSLTLEWGVGKGTSDQYKSQLEDLEPHQNLKELSLNDYRGVNLSSWLLSGNHVQLIKLALRRCHKCKVLPNVHFPALKSLVLDDMAVLEYIEDLFPSLQELWLTELPELKGWREVEVHEKPTFSCLSKLIIQDCPKLVSMPLFPTLEEELMLDSTSLKPFQETLALKNQASPPLSKLKNLCFVGTEELDDNRDHVIPWEALTSLRSLKLDHLPNLSRLPKGIQHLTSLQELSIWRCKMKVLPNWINNLKSLEKLAIWVCPKFKSLPQGISGLTSLKTLDIEDCPILLQRCQKATGADWDKIAHIPNKPSGVKIQPDDREDEFASSGRIYKYIIIINHH